MLLFIFKLCVCLCTIFAIVYAWFQYRFTYWKKKNVFCPPFTFPMGHFGGGLQEKSIGLRFMDYYLEYKKEPLIGVYMCFARAVVIHDLDLLKNVLSKDAHYFQGHGFHSDKNVDPLSQHLFNLEGADWRRMRTKLTPTFTSSKMKYMFDTLKDCTEDMVRYLNAAVKEDEVVDMKEIAARLGTDVISSCAFGLKSNSFDDPNSEFRKMGRKIFAKNPFTALRDIIAIFSPPTMDVLKLRRINKELSNFFYNTVKETIEYREKNNVQRNDFLQLLIDMRKNEEKSGSELTIMEITAQVFIFFAAGFETSSTAAMFAMYELSLNNQIRDKFVKEIDQLCKSNDGNITYEMIHDFQLLTQIVNETLRMYPPLPIHFRRCTEDYQVPGSDVIIEKGTTVIIPCLGIHRDPDIYPYPTKFDPERFSPEQITERHSYAHIPFGEGPRICIGNRFGMMQVKLALFTIYKNFKVEVSSKTQVPLRFNPKTILMETKDGMYLKLTPRFEDKKNQ